MKFFTLIYLISCIATCNSLEKSVSNKVEDRVSKSKQVKQNKVYGESDIVSSSILDKNGNLWFGTTDEGVFKYDGKTFTQFLEEDGLCDNEVWSMIEAENGVLWFGTGNGLCSFDGKTFNSIPIPWDGENDLWGEMCNPNIVMSLMQDRAGDIWAGTCGGGAFRYDGKTFTNFLEKEGRKQKDSLHHNLIKSIIEDTEGSIWFSSMTHGSISQYDGKEFTYFFSEDGIYDDMVFCSLKDKVGDLWFGCIQTVDGGLYRYDGKEIHNYNNEDGLCDNFIFGLYQDKNYDLWVSTGKGLCLYNGESFTPMFWNQTNKIHEVRTFVEDKEGRLWFGGRRGSLWRYDGKELMDFTFLK